MPLQSKDALYTDVDPSIPTELLGNSAPRRVLKEGDPDARYLICGAGGTLPDDIAQRFGLANHASTATIETATIHADLAALNRQTYTDNAQALGGAHKSLDATPTSTPTAPEKPAKGK